MTIRSKILSACVMLFMALSGQGAVPENFIDFSPAKQPLEIRVHLLVGGNTVLQNYRKTFPVIQNLNSNMGIAPGAGARVTFGLRQYLGLTTEANILCYGYNMDMAVISDDGSRSMSALFVNNRFWYFNVPVCMTMRFNVAHSVRWNVDLGLYYSYGLGGRQRQSIYHAEKSEIGQLVAEKVEIKSDYFHSAATFQNSFHRSDIGLHFGSSLDFGPHLSVGFRLQSGFKNVAYCNDGLRTPSIHNIALHGMLGWRF